MGDLGRCLESIRDLNNYVRIKEIRARPLLPLYEFHLGGHSCVFSNTSIPIFQADREHTPVALSSSDARLEIELELDPPLGFDLSAFYIRPYFDGNNGQIMSSVIRLTNHCRSQTFSWTLESTPEPTVWARHPQPPPWAFQGAIHWLVLGEQMETLCELRTTEVELYILDEDLPKIILDGIPVDLLRQLLSPGPLRSISDGPKGWIDYVANFLCSQNVRYETFTGICNYTEHPVVERHAESIVPTKCYIEHWIRHMKESSPDIPRAVNCFDTAVLGQVMLSIGLGSSKATIRLKYLKPFGFIRPTKLIGIEGLCNNPLFKDGNNQLVPWDSDNRTSFRSHTFLTVDYGFGPKVFDAACGPQRAEWTLQHYIEGLKDEVGVIDKDACDQLRDANGELRRRAGRLWEVLHGPGVGQLVSPIDIQGNPFDARKSAAAKFGIVKSMKKRFKRELGWPSFHMDGVFLNISWLLNQARSTTPISIQLFATTTSDENDRAALEYTNRLRRLGNTIRDWIPSDITTITRGRIGESPDGTAHAIWLQGHRDNSDDVCLRYVTIIKDCNDGTRIEALARDIAEMLADEITHRSPALKNSDIGIRGVPDDFDKPVQIDSNVILEAECKERNNTIIGANVDTINGYVVYLGSQTLDENRVQFKFYARHKGHEVIQLSFFDSQLNHVINHYGIVIE